MRLHWGKKEKEPRKWRCWISTTVIWTSCDFWWKSDLTSSMMTLGIVSLCVEDRAGRWQGPPPSVRRILHFSSHSVQYTRPAQRFICGRPDSHEQRYQRSIHTTTIVATVQVCLRFYQLYNSWSSSSSSRTREKFHIWHFDYIYSYHCKSIYRYMPTFRLDKTFVRAVKSYRETWSVCAYSILK